MGKALNPEVEKAIVDNALLLSSRKIASKLSVSRDSVRRVLKKNNVVVPESLRAQWRSESAQSQTTFTSEEDEIIINEYLTTPVKSLGKILGRSFCGITTRMKQLGLVIPQELKEKRKSTGLFKKGQEPKNKGKKMSPEAYEKYKHTFFQKGQIPGNAKKDGEEVIRMHRGGRSYKMIKVPEYRRLVYKHIWLWEVNNGRTPDDHAIVFKDGNSLNCELHNLECVSKVELMKRNTIGRYPEDLQKAMRLQGAIKRRIKHLKKQQ
ncbi:HNH endonuclease signature motif containing protein [Chryseobacterium caseinilyticum]|uniref:HNH endonuclease n=1 Tax=Chryseobacterium caseinilyticum TaxID=2771428 RepID=A0ABR8Z734_9FLAO|nr:HNH endonuclease signature motif containing protein [Chryseobacterium caseinilyticum]MBD8081097.1 HNH endonuclease [Chryseobacterium caseinilyticum]